MQSSLDGFTRFKMVRMWLRGDRKIDKEEYIKKLCKKNGLAYTPPVDLEQARAISPRANMFPVNKQANT